MKKRLKQPRRLTAFLAMLLVLVFAVFTVVAEQNQELATDASAEEVVREILEIQSQLGGSIVKASAEANNRSLPPRQSPAASQAKVEELREAAWCLSGAAHRLECVDLYDQADAIRELATRLRGAARQMKLEAEKPE